MDKDTRSQIQRATQQARSCLEREFAEQLEGIFDIRPDGTIPEAPGAHLDAAQRVTRRKLVAAIEHHRPHFAKKADAVDAYLREAAFTTLNRFVALKMLEARGLVQECISREEQSSGFKEFTGLAPGLVQLPDHGYCLYIECLFDEIGREVKVLFNRMDPASLLWPRRQALAELLAILNAENLAGVWGEDETIGWVYQYFNSDDERTRMRDESPVPRNTRELAVRNQFFTPRYVVEFLTDNTLGRIWHEMRQGDTRLVEDCNYLVRRSREVFLAAGEVAPEAEDTDDDLSQEELLKRTVYIPFRAKKDPRDLKILDPACGSGHFLLYTFDLLLSIYEEGWIDETAPVSEITGNGLRADYPTMEALKAAVPGLILRHNLHGIDIDPRAAQIASLALWMRAQRAYNDLEIARGDRQPIRKTNVVVAEPMPGESQQLEEFTTSLDNQLGQLIRKVFNQMELAGEAGPLLKIEEAIQQAVREIIPEFGGIFQGQDEQRWLKAEAQLLEALKSYSAHAQNGETYTKRLFAEDAERGFAFIDLCRQRYDVLLMNPPFGEGSEITRSHIQTSYPYWNKNLLCAFLGSAQDFILSSGFIGAVFDKTALIKKTYEGFREQIVYGECPATTLSDLGWNVLDKANVEVALGTFAFSNYSKSISLFRLGKVTLADKPHELELSIHSLHGNTASPLNSIRSLKSILSFPNKSVPFDVEDWIIDIFSKSQTFESVIGKGFNGLQLKAESNFRLFWEINPYEIVGKGCYWSTLYNGSEFSLYNTPIRDIVRYGVEGNAVLDEVSVRWNNKSQQQKHGICWGKRGDFIDAHILPEGAIFTVEGQGLPLEGAPWLPLGFLNSKVCWFLVNFFTGQHKYASYVGQCPMPPIDACVADEVSNLTQEAFQILQRLFSFDETTRCFSGLENLNDGQADEVISKSFEGYSSAIERLSWLDTRINKLVYKWYKLTDEAIFCVEDFCKSAPSIKDIARPKPQLDEFAKDYCQRLVSFFVGIAYGRWHVDKAVEIKHDDFSDEFVYSSRVFPIFQPALVLDSGNPQSPLCSHGIDGILLTDQGADKDISSIIKSLLLHVWGDEGYQIEMRLLEHLGCDLSAYLSRPQFFFEDHLTRYTKSRRKAPVYWQLSSQSSSYSIWLYYHRLTKDTFYKVNEYVKLKINHEDSQLASLIQDAGPNPSSGQRKEIATQESFVAELRAFRDEVGFIAPLWNPNLNDGVIINFAPLWRLVPHHRAWQKECKACWDKLISGDYDWAHLAMHLWPERVVPKCMEDRSLAIAHGLEDELWQEDPTTGKWQPRKVSPDALKQIIQQRTSPAVKDALKSLLAAPTPGGTATRSRRRRS